MYGPDPMVSNGIEVVGHVVTEDCLYETWFDDSLMYPAFFLILR